MKCSISIKNTTGNMPVVLFVHLRQGYAGHYFAIAAPSVWPATRSVADAKCGCAVCAVREPSC